MRGTTLNCNFRMFVGAVTVSYNFLSQSEINSEFCNDKLKVGTDAMSH